MKARIYSDDLARLSEAIEKADESGMICTEFGVVLPGEEDDGSVIVNIKYDGGNGSHFLEVTGFRA